MILTYTTGTKKVFSLRWLSIQMKKTVTVMTISVTCFPNLSQNYRLIFNPASTKNSSTLLHHIQRVTVPFKSLFAICAIIQNRAETLKITSKFKLEVIFSIIDD